MKKNLIYDVGMHSGKDTEFYLKKGFNVVAIEANPALVRNAEEKFKKETDKGTLVIVNKAISEQEGKKEFFINQKNDEWSTISHRLKKSRRITTPSRGMHHCYQTR